MGDISEFDGVSNYVERTVCMIHKACFILCFSPVILQSSLSLSLLIPLSILHPHFFFFISVSIHFSETRPRTEKLNQSIGTKDQSLNTDSAQTHPS